MVSRRAETLIVSQQIIDENILAFFYYFAAGKLDVSKAAGDYERQPPGFATRRVIWPSY
jgi:hypothetical protein